MEKISYNSFSRNFALVLLFILLMYGPITHSTYGQIVRIMYLIVLPYLIYWSTNFILNKINANEKTMIILERSLFTLIGFYFAFVAFEISQQSYHFENTKTIMTRNGYEDIGDDIMVEGANWKNVFLSSVASFMFIWYGFLKYIKINSDLK